MLASWGRRSVVYRLKAKLDSVSGREEVDWIGKISRVFGRLALSTIGMSVEFEEIHVGGGKGFL